MSSIKGFKVLNSTSEFNKIYSKATHCWHTEYFVLFYKKSSTKEVAFVASKKVGKAVFRNRAKRLLKAHFIIYSDNLVQGQYIFIAKTPLLNSDFQKLTFTFNKIYKRLKLIN